MKMFFALLVAFSAQALACDFNFPLRGVCGTVRWTQGPVLRTESVMEIEFTPAIDASQLIFDAWMTAHHHGTRPVSITVREDGIVEISKLYFVMPGEWMLRARLPLVDADGTSLLELSEMPVQL